MRLPLLRPDELSPEQEALYDRNRRQIEHGFTAFRTMTDDEQLLGPWGVFLHEPTYELYAHAAVASADNVLTDAKIATLAAGARPADLTDDEACAYDVTHALMDGGVLPDATYAIARESLGKGALMELVMWISTYAGVSLVLNAFDVRSEASYDTAAKP